MQGEFPNYYNIISNNIKNLRISNGISQESFAEKLGCSREYISRLENHHEQISLQMMLNVSKVFNIKPQDLFEET